MNQTIGLTLGKYAPFHRGHQFVIETALAECDRVQVIIYDCPEPHADSFVCASRLDTKNLSVRGGDRSVERPGRNRRYARHQESAGRLHHRRIGRAEYHTLLFERMVRRARQRCVEL